MSIALQTPSERLENINLEDIETVGIIIIIVGAIIYFTPSILALLRGKKNTIAIMALNLFLGWTLIGWVVSLVWSLSSNPKPAKIIVNQQNVKADEDEMDKLNKLKKLLDDGTLSQEEFELQKKKILNT